MPHQSDTKQRPSFVEGVSTLILVVPRPLRTTIGALALAGAMITALAACGEARAARNLEIAVQDDPVFLGDSYRSVDRERGFRFLRSIGVSRLRVNLTWAQAMPSRQARARRKPRTIDWSFALYDAMIDAAARHGIRVHLSLAGPAPVWASGNRRLRGGVRPNPRYFGEFARVSARHFEGRIDRYSIWNEPNWRTWLQPLKQGPALYRALYTRAYAAIKRADRRAKVLIGETSPYARPGYSTAPIAFLRRLACVNRKYRRVGRCKPLKADGYAHHPYEFRRPPSYRYPGADNATMGTLSNLTRALDRLARVGALRYNGRGRMPLYLTEFGYFQSGHRALPARTRSRYLQQGFDMALRNPRVKSQLQYLLVSPPRGAASAFFNTALISQRGSRYPQYSALQRWYRKNRGKVKRPPRRLYLPDAPTESTAPTAPAG
jgi:hypothetical protein